MGKIKLLLVDDEKDLIDVLAELMTQRNYKVLSAFSGSEALAVFKKEKPDVIVSDVHMADGDGPFLIGEIVKSEYALPLFYFMSGFMRYEKQALIELGARDVFTKPIRARGLDLMIKEGMASSALDNC